MNKILDNLYVTDRVGTIRREALQHEKIDFVVDVSVHFEGVKMHPRDSILGFAWGVLGLMEKDYNVLLYCDSGIERSPFIAAVVVKLYYGSGMEYAYKKVAEARPQTMVHAEWVDVIGLEH